MQFLQKVFERLKAPEGNGGASPAPRRRPGDVLESTLIDFGHGDHWKARDAFEGTQIFGAIGSGKTSGSGQAIAEAFLKAGFGGVVLTAKPGEYKEWQWFMKRAGRDPKDLIEFSPNSGHRFNFLDYERRHGGDGAGFSENLVSLFFTVAEAGERGNDQGGGEAFWKHASRQLLRNTIDALLLADEPLTTSNISRFISSAPRAVPYVPEWPTSYFDDCMKDAHAHAETGGESTRDDYLLVYNYWFVEFPSLAPETRASVLATFTGVADKLMRSPLRELFGKGESTVTPEDTHQGKVIVVNLPIRKFNEVGKLAQVLFKYCWQRATERRPAASQVPVFLWADESQFFINSHDMLFQTTARSSQAATVYLSQNLPNYYAVLSGSKGKHEADSLLGNFQTKIFHANSDSVTNQWASELIAKDWTTKVDTTNGRTRQEPGEKGKRPTSSSQVSINRQTINEFQVQPVRFTRLKKGGPSNDCEVEAIVCQGGRIWSHGKNHAQVTFRQKERDQAS